MAGVKTLRKIQLGVESIAGTEVAATTVWRGLGTINDETEIQFPDEDVGLISPTLRSYIGQYVASLEMPDTELTFEQFPYICQAGINNVSGVQDGAGSGYVYTYNLPSTAQLTPKTYTLEMGNDQQEEQMLYSFVREFGISGAPGEALMMSATWQGRRVEPGTFTGSVSLPVVEECIFQMGKIYVDDAGTAFGTTQISAILMGMSMTYNTGVQAVFTADGALQFTETERVRPELELELSFRHTSDAVAEIVNWRAETERKIRLEFLGSALTSPVSETNKRLTIDVVGKFATVGPLEDSDGNDVRTFTLRAGYGLTDSAFGQIVIVNELSALP